jgi:hypothetical protein
MSAQTLLTVEEATARLKISKHPLNRWRVTGEGPPFVKYGPRLVHYVESVLRLYPAPHPSKKTRCHCVANRVASDGHAPLADG